MFAIGLAATSPPAAAQTTQGMLIGRVLDTTGAPLERATLRYCRLEADGLGCAEQKQDGVSDPDGGYAFFSLTPGAYWVQASCKNAKPADHGPQKLCGVGEQGGTDDRPQEVFGLLLHVSGRLERDFKLRPMSQCLAGSRCEEYLSVGESQTLVSFYTTDVRGLSAASMDLVPARSGVMDAAVSQVVDSRLLERLPFRGRDVYAGLVLQPGATADNATVRGLGLSVHGK